MQFLLPKGFTFIINVRQSWNPLHIPYHSSSPFSVFPEAERFLESKFCASIPYPRETGLEVASWCLNARGIKNYLFSYMATLFSSHSFLNHQIPSTQSFHPSWTQLNRTTGFDPTNRLLLTRGYRERLGLPSPPVKSVTVFLGQL